MKKFMLIALCLSLYSLPSFSLTRQEENAFRARVSEMGKFKKGLSITLSGVGLVAACSGGGVLTGISAIIDSVPFASTLQFMITIHSSEKFNTKKSNAAYEVAGGLPSIIIDLLSSGYDVTDLRLDDPVIDEMRKAYQETSIVADQAFGESGYCNDQWEQLGILLELK